MEHNNSVNIVRGVDGLKKRKMSVWAIAFIIYCMTAAGAFGIEAMIPSCGPGMTIVILTVLPIVWVIPICLAVSELSAFMPEERCMYGQKKPSERRGDSAWAGGALYQFILVWLHM